MAKMTVAEIIELWNEFVSLNEDLFEERFANNEENEEILYEYTESNYLEVIFQKYDQDIKKKATLEAPIRKANKPIYKSEEDNEAYLHLCDLHLPFHEKEIVEAIVENYANKGYNLIINGDLLDCHDISTFPKSKAVGLTNEVTLAKNYLSKWSKEFKKIYLIGGNHERRMASYIRKRITPEVVSLVEDDILQNIVLSLNLPNIIYTTGDTNNWYVQIDNVICCHPDDYKRGILSTAASAIDYFDAYNPSANIIITGHTHHLGKAVHRGKIVIEAGCLCQPQDYAASGKLTYTPQSNGFLVFHSKNGRVRFNDINVVFTGDIDD